MKKIFSLSLVIFFALTSYAGAQTKVVYSVTDDPIPIVKSCTTSIEQGGWSGVCRDRLINAGAANTLASGCISTDNLASYLSAYDLTAQALSIVSGSGAYHEQFVGYCDISGDQCCVEESKVLKNPTEKNYSTTFISDNLCEKPVSDGGYGGSCSDQDAGLTWGLAGEDPTCANGETFVSYCDQGLDSKAGCCVPKDGEYCKKLETTGNSCSGDGANVGTASALEYGDYQLLESIPGSSSDASDLPTYLQNIYQAGLVLIVLGAIFMIGMGGFTYIASAGNTHTMAKGKGMIQDALYGLIVALAIWLILNIINPDLVNLTIETPSTLDFDPLSTNIEDDAVSASNAGSVPAGVKRARAIKCPTALVNIPSDIPLKGGTNKICSGLLTELQKLKSVSGWRITRLTGGGAQSSCHKVGTDNTGSCADIAFAANPGFNSPKWDELCKAAASMKGVRVLNEASNSPTCSKLFGNFIKTPNQTGAHLHIDYTGN